MMQIPETSSTLLKCLGQNAQSARWGDFVKRYEPVRRAFLASHFPSVPADDIMQETLLALVQAMPSYVYSPKEHGHFRDYLTGILRNKALLHLRVERKAAKERRDLAEALAGDAAGDPRDFDERAFQESIYELALAELLADPAIAEQTKRIFERVAVNGEKPADVAAAFGVTRNAVDQAKSRMVARLREIKDRLAGKC